MNGDPSDDIFDLGDEGDTPTATPAQKEAQKPENKISDTLAASMAQMNDKQREAVLAPDGPLLVLAGAGTGKTRVLTTRIAHKLATGQAWPSQFLAVTFTNKAAREMKARIGALVGTQMENMPWLGTFHSISAKILRHHAELVGLRSDFTILDADDQIRLVKQILQDVNIDEKKWPARQMAGLIDQWKNRGLQPDQVPPSEAEAFANKSGGKIYTLYQKRLKTLNAADFGDLLLECLRLFQENPDVLAKWQNRFEHMLVDEYQDTNTAQYLWLRLLAQEHGNICCVGDDDQSIYGWRGAEVNNILRFEEDFSGATIIRLEQNYRSTTHILGAATELIKANQNRLGKTLWTDIKGGEKVTLRSVWDGMQEAHMTSMDIENHQHRGHQLNEIAILVRASFQMREFEDRFIAEAIPYRVIGGPRFYERAEIRDANAYLRLIAQPDDDLAFERICNKPRRGLGSVSLQTLHQAARGQGVSLMRAASKLIETDELKPASRKKLDEFVQSLNHWRQLKDTLPPHELAKRVLDESGYMQMWQATKTPDAPAKLDNLKELIRSMEEFSTLAEYLEHIALVMEAAENGTDDKVSLMTLHAAKGLEFETVFLPGWEEGVFPNQRSLDESGDKALEEERRLAHVGLTRAKKRATISFAGNRKTHGQWVSNAPSRFIGELPSEHIHIETTDHGQAAKTSLNIKSRPARAQKAAPIKDDSKFTRKTRVFHQKFGYGRIEAIDGNKCTVAFEKAGVKKVLDNFLQKADSVE